MGRGNTKNCAAAWNAAARRTARHHGTRQHRLRRHSVLLRAAPWVRGSMYNCAAALTRARQHICAATQLRGSIHERSTIANIDVNEAATNETIRVAAIHKKIIYVCNGWHGRYTYTGRYRSRLLAID